MQCLKGEVAWEGWCVPSAYTAEEAARIMGVGIEAIIEAIDDELLPALRCGTIIRILADDLDRFLGGRYGILPLPKLR